MNGLEPGGSYTLTAEWTCPASPGVLRSGPASVDEIPFLAGGGSLDVAVDSPRLAGDMFAPDCVVGTTPPLPATLVLSRTPPAGALERSATLPTAVSRPT